MRKRKITARGILRGEHIECPVTITGEYSEFDADPVIYKIMLDMPYFSQYIDNRRSHNDRLSVRGETDEGKQIFIPDFKITSYASYTGPGYSHDNPKQVVWTATADTFVEGQLGEFETAGGEVICSLFTSPSPFSDSGVDYLRYQDGQIKLKDNRERRGIKWMTPLGEAEYIDEYDYLTSERVGIEAAVTQIKRSCILLRSVPKEKANLEEILINAQEDFDNVMWLMSFLARRRIVWYEGKARFFPTESAYGFRQVFIRRNKWLGYTNKRVDNHPLIESDKLRDGLFEQLLSQYQSSPFRDIIHQTIIHLLMSYEQAYLENQYTSVYTGLEGLVSGLGSGNPIGVLVTDSKFKEIRKKIEAVLKNELDSTDLVEGMSKKISELQRRSFKDQLLLQLQHYQIEIETLWPRATNGEAVKNLRDLITRRNKYMHQGRMEDNAKYYQDILRIQYLLEMWVLRLLQCPEDSVSDLAKPYL